MIPVSGISIVPLSRIPAGSVFVISQQGTPQLALRAADPRDPTVLCAVVLETGKIPVFMRLQSDPHCICFDGKALVRVCVPGVSGLPGSELPGNLVFRDETLGIISNDTDTQVCVDVQTGNVLDLENCSDPHWYVTAWELGVLGYSAEFVPVFQKG
jgi:hypothetical protein